MAGKIPTIVVTDNNSLRELISDYVSENISYELLEHFDDNSELFNTLSSLDKSLLLVDMDSVSIELLESVTQSASTCKIVAIKENPDVSFIVQTIRAGAKEIISYPLIKREVLDVLKRIASQFSENVQKQDKCKMITVFSNKGGIGKTSIASNLALELAKITKENVALVDLNFQFGDVTSFLDIKPSFDISYMLKNVNTINKDFLLSTMEKYQNTSLYVLADPPDFKQVANVTHKQVAKLFEILKESFSYIVVDTDSNFDEKTITALDYSDMLFLVTIVNLPALRNCQRCLDLFDKLGYDKDKVQIVINRFMENDEISSDDVEKLLQKKIYWKIPNNYFAMMASINKGILLSDLNPTSNVATSYRELAMHVSDSVFRKNLIKKFSGDNIDKLEQIFRS